MQQSDKLPIQCPSCGAKFAVSQQLLTGKQDLRFQCFKCQNVFSITARNSKLPSWLNYSAAALCSCLILGAIGFWSFTGTSKTKTARSTSYEHHHHSESNLSQSSTSSLASSTNYLEIHDSPPIKITDTSPAQPEPLIQIENEIAPATVQPESFKISDPIQNNILLADESPGEPDISDPNDGLEQAVDSPISESPPEDLQVVENTVTKTAPQSSIQKELLAFSNAAIQISATQTTTSKGTPPYATISVTCTAQNEVSLKYLELTNPPRLVIDFLGIQLKEEFSPPSNNFIQGIRTGVHPDKTRVVIDLKQQFQTLSKLSGDETSLEIQLQQDG
jgi:predicted Zn finger-like uncharacterized protein